MEAETAMLRERVRRLRESYEATRRAVRRAAEDRDGDEHQRQSAYAAGIWFELADAEAALAKAEYVPF
jgi:hypothetical protein